MNERDQHMRMSDRGRALLAEWEGMRLEEYRDAVGFPTLGVGHMLTRTEIASGAVEVSGRLIHFRAGISRDDALAILAQDIEGFEDLVSSHLRVPVTQNQFDALVSFAFNVGGTAFLTSELLWRLNDGHPELVPAQLRVWVNAGGHRILGLVARRENEIALWQQSDDADVKEA